MNTCCHGMNAISPSAKGAPMTCPADPAAVAIPSARLRFSSLVARPMIARITPKPVPAMPKPTAISHSCIASGVVTSAVITSPSEYRIAPRMIASLSPMRSASAPKIGCPIPQARFWIAIAIENSARGQLNVSAMGI